ncbi:MULTISPECIES: 50S ribosomal protein L6 [unclassified Colwellia]|jgi:large subunit ribosomal protein L6|uniref:50S ribosomal protein L6 n=1 Tax=unclassified Colwellia TaxID=196834 RepID=UPI0015F394F8|nr:MULTISPECIES: 50S ribosomal protein L6 [unclassified Colwellia]MBA6234268.1 50S ribosomal protein L6 [Colwellia sp. MB02u-7]MBA6237436.1 50S ribosomal protein L6 [Colwellia sp. MB02u-11]MBA6256369.1 50S ribosomal protein L6 [Colwellia sp. MB3u-28]MBA6260253.1 50S ribosomal protein L6 [Colwellia sp. MB3u-41]MBA6265226.1 50S ribosomal protein L6 [Colwellia sp. Bg11-12]
MSRVAKAPVVVPAGVTVTLSGQDIQVKGPMGELSRTIHSDVVISQEENSIITNIVADVKGAWAQAGTARALINNMVEGVSTGYAKTLLLNGVGYRAKAAGKSLSLSLGLSHPVNHAIPDGITVETPSQTEIILKGADKQLVGQVAADIRSYRKPEPYKGKGIRYSDEHVRRKEAKKK